MAAHQSGRRRGIALKGDIVHVDPGFYLEEFERKVVDTVDAGRSHAQPVGVLLGKGDKIFHRIELGIPFDHNHERHAVEPHDGRELAHLERVTGTCGCSDGRALFAMGSAAACAIVDAAP